MQKFLLASSILLITAIKVPNTGAEGLPGYFDFKADTHLVTPGKDISLEIVHQPIPNNLHLKIRPVSENTEISIKNPTNGLFIPSDSALHLLPDFNQAVTLKLFPTELSLVEISLDILDTVNGVFYTTPKHKFWIYRFSPDLLKKTNLGMTVKEMPINKNLPEESPKPKTLPPPPINKPAQVSYPALMLGTFAGARIMKWGLSKSGVRRLLSALFYSGLHRNPT